MHPVVVFGREIDRGEAAAFEPGSRFGYSNPGIVYLGQVIERLSGEDYEVYIDKNILKPLGLSSTTPEMPASERGRRLAVGYTQLDRMGKRAALPDSL